MFAQAVAAPAPGTVDLAPLLDASVKILADLVLAVGGIVALWLASTVIGALNSIPLLPKVFELVGLTYSAWFTYRYLLFKSSREELVEDSDSLKKKISGEQ